MIHPKVSIVLPHIAKYDVFFKDCFDSILAQSLTDYEVLIIDGSPEGPSPAATKLVNSDERFEHVFLRGMGLSASRNFGIGKARGDYICFVDSDDKLKPNYLETLAQSLDRFSMVDIAICAGERFFKDETTLCWGGYGPAKVIDIDDAWRFENAGRIGPWCHLIRRRALHGIRFNEQLHAMEDRQFFFDLYMSVRQVVENPQSLYCYRQNPDSQTSFRSLEWFSQTYLDKMQVSGHVCDLLYSKKADRAVLHKSLKSDVMNYLSYRWLMFSFKETPDDRCFPYKNASLRRSRRASPVGGVPLRMAMRMPHVSYWLYGRWIFGKEIRKARRKPKHG